MTTSAMSHSVFKLSTHYRAGAGSHKCDKIRRHQRAVPGLIYGAPLIKHTDKILVQTNFGLLTSLRNERGRGFESTLVDLTVSNEFDSTLDVQQFRVLPRSVSYHPTDHSRPTSCNFLIYDEKVGATLDIPILVKDKEKSPGLKKGGYLNYNFLSLPVFVKGPLVPHSLEISVDGMQIGDRVQWSDIKWNFMPTGTSMECLFFRKSNFTKLGLQDLTILSLSGKRQQELDEATSASGGSAPALEKF
ncbi:hypothetical protein BASA81_007287 [Batrachochytrium salamandrivorans]|nr:hypothetical protein BASA81_007287 [Batrachochytrium salamandrivorans]